MSLMSKKVLLLNQSFEPLAILKAKTVLRKILGGSNSFHIEEYYPDTYKHGKFEIKIPSVVRLSYFLHIKRNIKSTASGKKMKIFARDSFQCLYCGYAGTPDELTLDHILPKSRGGDSSPSNLASCCKPCNSAKNDLTSEEFGYSLSKSVLYSNINLALLLSTARKVPSWRKYLFIESEHSQHEEGN